MSAEATTMRPESGKDAALADRDFGFWVYLMSDAIIFALLFATYLVLKSGTAGGPTGQDLFDINRTFAETMLLLASSVTFGMASVAVAGRNRAGVVAWLAVTFVLGAAFLALEFGEFAGMIAQDAGPGRSGFLSAFFTLVGTHGLHVSGGLVWIAVMIAQVRLKGLTAPVVSRLFRLGLFWHFLDIVWIGIFSVVYLPGVM
ncbi:cytochrome o ubiquinol oxidase subunit III [Microbaculum marinisediminis]|uniref:Cytochrome bo(3) ubiquinol oxidase subunit 3 n=1 Tax=Microbaculum marinisediminis TaxID=2931392 RepID=A0AAW5QUZ2_9HYPH|nr:cytochrome o ubiquinol oxidase subunit III [Microbaculum sp. A6E488]MCT8970724.1 cytochrome o ubiquinol oxidase subunit III [Microbaculum sp. A6E488]